MLKLTSDDKNFQGKIATFGLEIWLYTAISIFWVIQLSFYLLGSIDLMTSVLYNKNKLLFKSKFIFRKLYLENCSQNTHRMVLIPESTRSNQNFQPIVKKVVEIF